MEGRVFYAGRRKRFRIMGLTAWDGWRKDHHSNPGFIDLNVSCLQVLLLTYRA